MGRTAVFAAALLLVQASSAPSRPQRRPLPFLRGIATLQVLDQFKVKLALANIELSTGLGTIDLRTTWVQQNCINALSDSCNGAVFARSEGYDLVMPNGSSVECSEMSWTKVLVPRDGGHAGVSSTSAQIPHSVAVAGVNESFVAGIDRAGMALSYVAMDPTDGTTLVPPGMRRISELVYGIQACSAVVDADAEYMYLDVSAKAPGSFEPSSVTMAVPLADPSAQAPLLPTPAGMPDNRTAAIHVIVRDETTGKLWGVGVAHQRDVHICEMPTPLPGAGAGTRPAPLTAANFSSGSCNPKPTLSFADVDMTGSGQRYLHAKDGFLYGVAYQPEPESPSAAFVIDLESAQLISRRRIAWRCGGPLGTSLYNVMPINTVPPPEKCPSPGS